MLAAVLVFIGYENEEALVISKYAAEVTLRFGLVQGFNAFKQHG